MTAFLALAVGCENNNPLASATFYPVKGKVLLPDGKPLTAGHVVFVSTKTTTTATATIESDGSFSFKGASGDGLPEGDYIIRIEGGSDGKANPGKSKTQAPFASQFLDEDASGLKATVTNEEAKNNFELKLIPTKSEVSGGDRRAAGR
jgi:hypothetical protein